MGIEISIEEMCEAMDAQLLQGDSKVQVQGAATDSRLVERGAIFFARIGENSDGHKYLNSAIESQAGALVVSQSRFSQDSLSSLTSESTPVLVVVDSDKALADLATHWRKKFKFPVIAITGSNGKTTTKEMLRTVLAEIIGEGTASEKSYNNHVGVPLTILSCPLDSSWLVLEMGMNHSGELSFLGDIGQPDIGVILNVGPAHLGHFQSLSEIADAKCELASKVRKSGTLIFPDFDNEIHKALNRTKVGSDRLVQFGTDLDVKQPESDGQTNYFARDTKSLGIDGLEFIFEQCFGGDSEKCEEKGKKGTVKLSQLGLHNVRNASAALAAVFEAFPDSDWDRALKAISKSRAASMRIEAVETDRAVVVNDLSLIHI